MNKKYKYLFDKQSGILYKTYFGEITLYDITSSWDRAIQNNIIPNETKGFILDYREAFFRIKTNETSGIAEYYRNNLKVFNNMRIAIITESHKDIIVPILVKEEDFNYSSRPFSTIEAAVSWIVN
ncbi:MAG: hypothetical protein C0597_01990 [Marinilabiliales bacterium]|nr:MAG: hypothetical protein C0597_01990 [Marinilabiliales bacterium]